MRGWAQGLMILLAKGTEDWLGCVLILAQRG